jgi:hypothetical protein
MTSPGAQAGLAWPKEPSSRGARCRSFATTTPPLVAIYCGAGSEQTLLMHVAPVEALQQSLVCEQ